MRHIHTMEYNVQIKKVIYSISKIQPFTTNKNKQKTISSKYRHNTKSTGESHRYVEEKKQEKQVTLCCVSDFSL